MKKREAKAAAAAANAAKASIDTKAPAALPTGSGSTTAANPTAATAAADSKSPTQPLPLLGIVGDAFVDIVAPGMSGLPKWNSDIVIPAITMHTGGSALNTAYNLAALQCASQLRVVVPIGDDEFGAFVTGRVSSIGLQHIVSTLPAMPNTPTGVCICMSGASDRCFVDCHGANKLLTAAHLWTGASNPAAAALNECRHIHFGGFFNTHGLHTGFFVTFLAELNAKGVTVSLDPQYDTSEQWTGIGGIMEHVLPCVDILLPSEVEACGMARVASGNVLEALSVLRSRIRPGGWVIIKCGADGCVAARAPSKLTRANAAVASLTVDPATASGSANNSRSTTPTAAAAAAATAASTATDDKSAAAPSTQPPTASAAPSTAAASSSASPVALSISESTYLHCSSFPITVVDTTGGGDSFDAGFLFQHFVCGASMDTALRYACASGAIRCTRVGASTNAPTREDVEAMLASASAASAFASSAPTAGGVVRVLPFGTPFSASALATGSGSGAAAVAAVSSTPTPPSSGSGVSANGTRANRSQSAAMDAARRGSGTLSRIADVVRETFTETVNTLSAAFDDKPPTTGTAVKPTPQPLAVAKPPPPKEAPPPEKPALSFRAFLGGGSNGAASSSSAAATASSSSTASASASDAQSQAQSHSPSQVQPRRGPPIAVIETDLSAFLNDPVSPSAASASASSAGSASTAGNKTGKSAATTSSASMSARASANNTPPLTVAESVAAATTGRPSLSGPASPAAAGWSSLSDGQLG